MVVETQIKVFASRIYRIAQMIRIKAFETRIIWMTQMALIFRYGQQMGMPGHVSSVKSFNPCKGWEPRIKKITRMTQTTRLNNEASEPFRRKIKSVKSLNPCKSVIQTLGVVWN